MGARTNALAAEHAAQPSIIRSSILRVPRCSSSRLLGTANTQ